MSGRGLCLAIIRTLRGLDRIYVGASGGRVSPRGDPAHLQRRIAMRRAVRHGRPHNAPVGEDDPVGAERLDCSSAELRFVQSRLETAPSD
jgi:hypothetical protein